MTLPQQLRAIADGLDALTVARNALIDELAGIAGDKIALLDQWEGDSTSAQGAVEDAAGEGHASPPVASAAAPIHAPGSARQDGDGKPARRRAPAAKAAAPQDPRPPEGTPTPAATAPVTCPTCDKAFATTRRVNQHRRFCKGRPSAVPIVLRRGVETPIEEPTERRWPARPTIAERVAARDAGRAGRAARQGRHVGGGA